MCDNCERMLMSMSLEDKIDLTLEVIKAAWHAGDSEQAHGMLHKLIQSGGAEFMSSEQCLKAMMLQTILCDLGDSDDDETVDSAGGTSTQKDAPQAEKAH